jgi:hypothetical protein
MSFLPKLAIFASLFVATILQSWAGEANGLYYVSSGEKADIKILQAHIYSENNANIDFSVRLDTSDYQVDPKTGTIANPVTLRISGHEYSSSGGGGKTNGTYNVMWFRVRGQDGVEAIAKWFSITCDLRSPPGYKLFAQFVPSKTEFNTNEPVMVKFQLKNLDERTVIFQRGGQQRGYRDNQYGFRAMMYEQTVPDIGNPMNFGGLCGLIPLDSGKVFEDQIDLKKWFAFNKPGTYMIHGFYQLDFYRPPLDRETFMPGNEIWSDYASADFTVTVK